MTAAISKASDVAKKQLNNIVIYNDTIPHEVEGKVSGAKILIKPAAAGTGLIAGGTVRVVLEVAGIKNALSKSFGSANKINVAYATLQALSSSIPAKNWITSKNKSLHASNEKPEKSKK